LLDAGLLGRGEEIGRVRHCVLAAVLGAASVADLGYRDDLGQLVDDLRDPFRVSVVLSTPVIESSRRDLACLDG
jgi:hypothetical protein